MLACEREYMLTIQHRAGYLDNPIHNDSWGTNYDPYVRLSYEPIHIGQDIDQQQQKPRGVPTTRDKKQRDNKRRLHQSRWLVINAKNIDLYNNQPGGGGGRWGEGGLGKTCTHGRGEEGQCVLPLFISDSNNGFNVAMYHRRAHKNGKQKSTHYYSYLFNLFLN